MLVCSGPQGRAVQIDAATGAVQGQYSAAKHGATAAALSQGVCVCDFQECGCNASHVCLCHM
jgi:hypothetical protein